MGVAAGTDAEIAESRRAIFDMKAAASPMLTAQASSPVDLPLQTNASRARLTLEDGESLDLVLARTARGMRFIAPAQPGYHRLEIGAAEMGLAVAPARAFEVEDVAAGRKLWGTSVQVYGLRDARSGAFGDFGALARFAAVAGRCGADALAISPVHALFLADASRYSPYSPSTRLRLNALYADASAMAGDVTSVDPGGDLIDWASAAPEKRVRLRRLFEKFAEDGQAPGWGDFEAFRASGGADLERHALFEALHDRFFRAQGARGWNDWPLAFQTPDGAAASSFARDAKVEIDFHIFVQWLADRGLAAAQAAAKDAGMAIGLIADLAVGMDPGGGHAWSRRGDILGGLNIGAPPDLFQAAGQDWGLAAFSPMALRRTGFEPFIATLRAALRHAGGMRIDHAMGLRRLWVTPQGSEAKDGAYLTYPFEDLLRLIVLESRRANAVVVGEDLGTVPPGFRESLNAAGVMGMRVLWFEREDQGFTPSRGWPPQAAAMTTTHDLPTVAGWWRERDIDWAVDLGMEQTADAQARAERTDDRSKLWEAFVDAGAATGSPPAQADPDAAVDAAIDFIADSACRLAIIPIEDLIASAEQPNLPGVVDGHPNWRRRLPDAAETLFARSDVRARIERLNRARSR
jgi:4-alpha-glucanotransferase